MILTETCIRLGLHLPPGAWGVGWGRGRDKSLLWVRCHKDSEVAVFSIGWVI